MTDQAEKANPYLTDEGKRAALEIVGVDAETCAPQTLQFVFDALLMNWLEQKCPGVTLRYKPRPLPYEVAYRLPENPYTIWAGCRGTRSEALIAAVLAVAELKEGSPK